MQARIEKYKLISGIFLWTFWITATVPFVVQESTGEYCGPVVNGLWGVGELIVAMLGLWTLRARVDKWILAIFIVVSFADTIIFNKLSLLLWLNGLRPYIGFLFMMPIIRYFWVDEVRRQYFVAKMDRLIYLYLVIQFPCMVVQCLRYGAFDNVSGSIGWMASGAASTIIYLSSFYLMNRRWDFSLTYVQNLSKNWVLLFLLIPTYLNETKVSFVYLALYFILLLPMDKQFLKRMIYVVPMVAIVMAGAMALYGSFVSDTRQEEVGDIKSYLLGNDILLDLVEFAFENDVDEVQEPDYARGLKFYLMPEIFRRHEGTVLTGFGLGQFKGGTHLEKTEFSQRYFWMLQGTIMQLQIALVEMGVPGALLYVIYWITVFRLWRRHKKGRNLRMTWMFGLVTIIFSIYNPPFFIPPFYMQFMFMVFTASRWNDLPAYRYVPLFGSRKIAFTWKERQESAS